MASSSELACVYASLILHDDGLPVEAEKISAILKAANVEVEPFWPGLFAKSVEGVNIGDLVTNVGSGVGAAPVGAPTTGGSDAAPKEEEKKKKKTTTEESDDDMGFGLFD
eukprot:m.9365 g.9365  ORF g.9365 m.9365 type:complete len:110 (-) comp7184_c0_seq1:35-364(-)